MRGAWSFNTAGEIIFGQGTAGRVGEIVRRTGAQQALLVTDQMLADAGVTTDRFVGDTPKATLQRVADCVATAKQGEYPALVALGGGSNVDVAKAAAVVLCYGGSPEDYFGPNQVPGPILPLVAVSTTAGTGSEVSGAAVLADPANRRRGAILSNYIRPHAAIYDPLLTLTCPPRVTADAGMDALTHAVESYMVVSYRTQAGSAGGEGPYHGSFPLSDMLAERAIELVGRYLRRAVYQTGDLEAREGMHLASLLAGMGFSNAGLNAVHALEYPVGVLTDGTHGAVNGLLLPYVMAYNVPACPQKLAKVAQLLGEETTGLSVWEAAERAVQAVQRLKEETGMTMRLQELGVKDSDLGPLAEATAQITRLLQLNPRPLDADGLEGILRRAW